MDRPRLRPRLRAGRTSYAGLGAAVALGLAARLSLAVKTSPQEDDAAIFGSWAKTLNDHPLTGFYNHAWRPDHLPGDLWVLKVLQMGYTAIGGSDFNSPAFEFLLKIVPVTADIVVGVVLFGLVRMWASEGSAVRAAQWYLLNPAVIALSAVWGQWDALSVAVVLCGLLMVARGGRGWVWAAPWLVWAALTKPPLVIFEVVILVWLLAWPRPRDGRGRPPALGRWDWVRFAALASATAVALLSPFRVGIAWAPTGGSSLTERLRFAADAHRVTTLGAPNIWMIIDRRIIGRADDVARWGSITPGAAATLLFVLVSCMVAVIGWRAFGPERRSEALLWSAAAVTFGSCLVLTRVHERYYFPALVLLLLWASTRGFDAISTVFLWTFSLLFIVDLAVPSGWAGHLGSHVHEPAVLVSLGLLHVVFFVGLLAMPWRAMTPARLRAGAPSGATGARRTAPG